MSQAPLQDADMAKSIVPAAAIQGTEREIYAEKGSFDATGAANTNKYDSDSEEDWEDKPTPEDLQTLRRVSASIQWSIYTIAFVECCERFSYYGSAVLYTNFVRSKLPLDSVTGAPVYDVAESNPGALGMGQKAGQGISLFNQFFAYLVPLFGAWLADAKYGRYKVIHMAIVVAVVAHVILVVASIPQVIVKPNSSFGAFIVGLILLCTGTGLFKANISPLLAEQNKDTRMRVEVQKGERVIVDPSITNARIFLWFYFAINVGATVGQVCMVFVAKYHSFWLAFLLPTVLFLAAPVVLILNKKRYNTTPPTGSVLEKFFKMFVYVKKNSKGFFTWDWEVAKPRNVPVADRPAFMTYDDAWVDEVKRGLGACKVFLFLPIFFLAYNQMMNNLSSQAATMELHGAPNDLIQNLNPLSIIIMIPILDSLVYPGFRKIGFKFTPIKRMATGFAFSAASMVAAGVMQHYIYTLGEGGKEASAYAEMSPPIKAPINVWAQSLPYVLVGLAEIFTNVSSLEYAFSKAPANMKSLVMAVNLFMSAISAALGQAFTPISADPYLVWNYTAVAIISAIGGIAFWFCFKHLDNEEDNLNMLKKTKFLGTNQPNAGGVREERV
ncbi:peptide transporter PTR2-A [Plectosphaerella plurivora]|uniref:Peptide transporter PTR2-A n=1 Tax=Plectosphaerella plurivora TaxID=936078 RepID=A0A9P8V7D1_9PEZI|nr:peptide transporter PTR2-A [Plectosphaerella plurivora]